MASDCVSYSRNFPKDKEANVVDAWPEVKHVLEKDFFVACTLNLVEGSMTEGSMTITQTRWTSSEDRFIKARVAIYLLSRGFPATKVIQLVYAPQYLIMDIGYQEQDGLCWKFQIKAEEYSEVNTLISGPDGSTLKALEEFAGGNFVVDGDILYADGHFEKLRVLRMIVEDCFIYRVSAASLITKVNEEGVHKPGQCYRGGCEWCTGEFVRRPPSL